MEGIGNAESKSSQPQFARRLVLAITCIAVLGATALTATSGAQDPGPEDPAGDLPLNPEWLSNTPERAATPTEDKNNTVDGAIESRDQAIAQWKAAQKDAKAYKPQAKAAQKKAKR